MDDANKLSRKLLADCMARSMQKVQDVRPADLQGTLTENDMKMLGQAYTRTFAIGVCTTSAVGALGMRITRSPVVSALSALSFGAAVTASDALQTFPKGLLKLMDPPSNSSTILDVVVCPAVAEFEPCLNDFHCRALLTKSEQGGRLLTAYEACRSRASQLRQSFSSANAEESRSAVAVAPPPMESSDRVDDPWATARGDEEPPQSQPLQQQQQQQQQQWPSSLETEAHPDQPYDHSAASSARETPSLPAAASGWDARAAPPGSSWDAVRARHLAAQEAGNTADGQPFVGAPEPPQPPVAAPLDPSGRRPKKNAYGDDVLE